MDTENAALLPSKYDEKTPPLSSHRPTRILVLDLEMNELDERQMLEVSAVILTILPGLRVEREHHHLVVEEYAHVTNKMLCAGEHHEFAHGASRVRPLAAVQQ